MGYKQAIDNLKSQGIIIAYKKSRFSHIQEKGLEHEQKYLANLDDTMVAKLIRAHENNLKSIKHVCEIIESLALPFELLCRSDLKKPIKGRMVLSVGGDGTLLDASHYCTNSPILGLNSDPEQSIGALCLARADSIEAIMKHIIAGTLKPTRVERIGIKIGSKKTKIVALNDVLFCHQNPAAMSRYTIEFQGQSENHRSSGVWIASAAGSTGAIFSSGAHELDLHVPKAIFRVREAYWCDAAKPALFQGSFERGQKLVLQSFMNEGHIYVDGPHKKFKISLGERVELSLADTPLWLFDGPMLSEARTRALEQRRGYRILMSHNLS